MKHNRVIKWFKNNKYVNKPAILVMSLAFISICVTSVYFYVHQLENEFLSNTIFYMSEIAEHDMKSVDQEIEKQWERLETIGEKLRLEQYHNTVDVQKLINIEAEATGFKELVLIDENGLSYSSNYIIKDVKKNTWGAQFMKKRERFVQRSQDKENFVVLYSNLIYGVPIKPVTINGTTYIGIAGKYSIDTVKDSLKVSFFNGEGKAEVIAKDGTVITTDVTQRGISIENVLKQLEKSKIIRNDSYESIKEKLTKGKAFDTVYKHDGETYIMSSKPLGNTDWMVVVTVPYSVSSTQTMSFLKITAILLSILCIIIAIVLIFAFISFKRTMILNNSKEIFYREKLFNLLTNHTDDVFIIQDTAKGSLNFISENITRILGITLEVGAKTDASQLDEETRTLLLSKIEKMKLKNRNENDDEHEHTEIEFAWFMPLTHEEKWMHMAIYDVIADFSGHPESCLIIVISDYTQVKENQEKLKIAMEQAQDAAKSKTLFLSNMSHEMRTPLNGIIGCMEMMKTHQQDLDKVWEYLGKAESTANYLISLVSDILDMSKIESHKMELEEREVSLREVVSNIDTMFRTQMEEKGLQFQIDIKEPLYKLYGDKVRIQQILVNLLGNAQKFTYEGGTVILQIEQEQPENGVIKTEFVVSDTGIGMSESFLERIWLPFEQERLDNARLHGGTGLGLSISYELAHLMNGSISVSSEQGKGSTFSVIIELPVLNVDNMEKIQEKKEENADNQLSGRTVLVAEDNELNREILVALLRDSGAKVLEAVNGKEAVEQFRQSQKGEIDVILMDMQMPIMDGCTAAREIRSLQREDAKEIAIIACTANAFREDVEKVKQAGMNEHISKPLDMMKLLDVLKNLWEEKDDEKKND